MSYNLTFKKSEKLCSKKEIEALFKNAISVNAYPLTLLWLKIDFNIYNPVKILISAPRKNLKNAVDRNLIKRRIREAYRKNKIELIQFLFKNNLSCNIAIIYNSKNIADYQEIESKIILLLQRLQKDLTSH